MEVHHSAAWLGSSGHEALDAARDSGQVLSADEQRLCERARRPTEQPCHRLHRTTGSSSSTNSGTHCSGRWLHASAQPSAVTNSVQSLGLALPLADGLAGGVHLRAASCSSQVNLFFTTLLFVEGGPWRTLPPSTVSPGTCRGCPGQAAATLGGPRTAVI